MNKLVTLTLLLAAAGAASQAQAQAQGVWRCGADGRSFSDRPCADGQPLQMAELADTRTAGEVQSAREVAARERRLAEGLRQERLQRERLALPPNRKPTTAHSPGASHRVRDLSSKRGPNKPQVRRPEPADDGIWRAIAPSSRRAQD
ncbi:MAG: hypothetical protein Q8M01_06245 [Rubrivivax sp.]|nr:hypothetical protein [Rubrivivax sp.]